MKKEYIEFEGKKYLTRVVDLSPILDGYGEEMVGCAELSKALQDATKGYTIENQDATDVDNQIYCYMDSGHLECDPTDAELLFEVMQIDGISAFTDQHWYNLMRLAQTEIANWYSEGRTLVNIEGYEYGGRYRVYIYHANHRYSTLIYEGNSASSAAMAMMGALITIRLMLL